MKLIPLTQGKFAQVDDEDFEWLNQFKWCTHKDGRNYYAERAVNIDGKRGMQKMHHFITRDSQFKLHIDHVDGNGLNNQKANLRPCTHAENMMNRRPQKNCSSIYKGVGWYRRLNKWEAHIQVNHRQIHLGCFIVEEDAARAYDAAATKYFGEFARLNLNHRD